MNGEGPWRDGSRAPERLLALDALRGVLAVGVMLFHLLKFTDLAYLNGIGAYGVYGFFTLSGVAMVWVYGPRRMHALPVRRFYTTRLARIAPLYVLATMLTTLTWWPGLVRLLANLSFLFVLVPSESIPLGGWSIGVEMQFYALFPLALVLARRVGWLVVASLVALVVRFWYVDLIWADLPELPAGSYFQMPSFAVFFLAGMAIGSVRGGAGTPTRRWPLVVALLAVVGSFALDGVADRKLLTGAGGLSLTLASIAVVALAAFSANPAGRLAVVSHHLGAISYGTYLLHPLVYKAAMRVPSLGGMGLVTVTAVGTVGLASIVERRFERPAAAWIRRRIGDELGSVPRGGR